MLAAALDLPESERDAFVARECGGRPDLLAEVESLLRAYRAAGTFIEPPSNEGRRIGPYRLTEQIGAGGMGVVYAAEREDDQFQQRVAIKLMGAGLEVRPDVVRRFLEERQILADLAHPNIARLLDGGCTVEGAPYIVMEHVDGVPITAYCDGKGLDLRARLGLFLQLADAVAFAHQHLVIHRDIKPSNILVTGSGIPKLLDFGVARLLNRNADRTGTMVQALTPDYASPEQARGAAMTTASDIYSLGVLLYELVAGDRPYRLSDKSLEQALNLICTRDPPPPGAIRAGLPADMDAIVMKAMRKEPADRYESVRELAQDIGRYLGSRPVEAHRGTRRYVALKFLRRHKVGAGVAALVALVLGVSIAAVVRASRIAHEERDRAQRRFSEVRRLAHSVIFDLDDKIYALPGSIPVRRDLIATAIVYVDGLAKESSGDLGLQSELAASYLRIGNVQGNPNMDNLGDPAGALKSFQKAETIARHLSALQPSFESGNLLAKILQSEGSLYFHAKEIPKAEACWKESIAIARDLEERNPSSGDAKYLLATSLTNIAELSQDARSLEYRMEALPLFEAFLAANPTDPERQRNVALVHKYIGGHLLEHDQSDRAFEHLQRAAVLDEARVAANPGNPMARLDLSFDYSQFGGYYEAVKNLPKAIEYTRRMAQIRRELAASDPRNAWKQNRLAYAVSRMGQLQLLAGDAKGALASYQEGKALGKQLLGSEANRMEAVAVADVGIGEARLKMGDRQASCAAYREALDLYRTLAAKAPLPTWQAGNRDRAEKAAAGCPAVER